MFDSVSYGRPIICVFTRFCFWTYRINRKHYCLYALVVMDANGFRQPAALGLLSSKQTDTLRSFFSTSKGSNLRGNEATVIFVDRDFTQLGVLNEELPNVPALICVFHVMKALNIFKEKFVVQVKQERLTLFKRILYSRTEDDYERNETNFVQSCPDSLAEYYDADWRN